MRWRIRKCSVNVTALYKYEAALICSLSNCLQSLSLCQLNLLGFLASLKSCSGKICAVFHRGWPHQVVCCDDLLALHGQAAVYCCVDVCITPQELFADTLPSAPRGNPVRRISWAPGWSSISDPPVACVSLLVVTVSENHSSYLGDPSSLPPYNLIAVWAVLLSLVSRWSSSDHLVGLPCSSLEIDSASEEQKPYALRETSVVPVFQPLSHVQRFGSQCCWMP